MSCDLTHDAEVSYPAKAGVLQAHVQALTESLAAALPCVEERLAAAKRRRDYAREYELSSLVMHAKIDLRRARDCLSQIGVSEGAVN